MRSTIRTALVTLGAAAVLVTLAGLAYIYSGQYNVAATAAHGALERWVLETMQENSVRAHADGIIVPSQITPEQRRQGAEHFREMCVVCHGAPGIERGEYGIGLTPTPPDLSAAARQWSAQELFWIVKHGIKLAGMPAFGPTHTDEQLWGIVAFLERLPQLSAAEYERFTGSMSQVSTGHTAHDGSGHDHPPDTAGTGEHTHAPAHADASDGAPEHSHP